MGPKNKQQLDKEAWQWAESTDPEQILQCHLEAAYRVNLRQCKQGSCRRNCKGNPHCLTGMGEREWMGDIADDSWHDVEDPNTERRKDNSFVGLKNLGATCYVNTLLQVWFHHPTFRAAILRCQEPLSSFLATETDIGMKAEGSGDTAGTSVVEKIPAEPAASGETGAQKKEEKKDLMPSSVCGHLQRIFVLLQFSNRRYIDPNAFIECLGLDAALQQDAQEFSKLFMSLLEDSLSQQLDPTVRNLVQEQFSGQYAYVTRCSNCNSVSERSSQFYELDLNIKGHSQLRECVAEFLEEEKLEGDNKYMCTQCNSKQDAGRRIQLQQLPPVLNLQLLRFVFDRHTGHKKKLNSYIQFPEQLDMSPYLNKPEGEIVYELYAVLIHRGPSAYSGHYVAHIKDLVTDTWYKFNDEEIEKVEGKKLQLGNEEDIEGPKAAKKPRSQKGTHASRNAYMLVYHRSSQDDKAESKLPELESLEGLPSHVQQYLKQDNALFDDWIKDMMRMREQSVVTGRAKQQEIKHLYHMLPIEKGSDFEWMSLDWLSKWLAAENSEKVPPVDNSGGLCDHGKLHPDKVIKMKCVRKTAAELLFTKYGGAPRLLNPDAFCRSCVEERCRVIRTKARIAEDNKFLSDALKTKVEQCGYWVGKASLRSWKRLVLEQLAEEASQNGNLETAANDSRVAGLDDSSSSAVNADSAADKSQNESTLNNSPGGSEKDPPECCQNNGQLSAESNNSIPGCSETTANNEEGKEEINNETSNSAENAGAHTAQKEAKEGEKKAKEEEKEESQNKTTNSAENADVHSARKEGEKETKKEEKETKEGKEEIHNKTVNSCENAGAHTAQKETKEGKKGQEEEDSMSFNEDLLCVDHGNLDADESCRKLVSDVVWQRLRVYFPKAPEFKWDAPICPKCQLIIEESERARNHKLSLAAIQKKDLLDLYLDRHRPLWARDCVRQVYVLSKDFLQEWRKFIKEPGKRDALEKVNNSIFVCPHGGFLYSPEQLKHKYQDDMLSLVWPQEMEQLRRHLEVDVEIEMCRLQEEDGTFSFNTSPAVCFDCCSARSAMLLREKVDFAKAVIFVRKILPNTKALPDVSSLEHEDPEFPTKAQAITKKRKSDGALDMPPEKALRIENGEVRRSGRTRRIRGDKEFSVSSSETLRDLKLKIMRSYSVAPFDQHLQLDGVDLVDDKLTLSDLHVTPGCILELRADEPCDDPMLMDDIARATHPEQGFKGTGLLGAK